MACRSGAMAGTEDEGSAASSPVAVIADCTAPPGHPSSPPCPALLLLAGALPAQTMHVFEAVSQVLSICKRSNPELRACTFDNILADW